MPNLICKNENCLLFNKDQFFHKIQLKRINDKLQPINPVFCKCGKELELKDESIFPSEITTSIGNFKMLSSTEKRESLKKRAKTHYEKNDKLMVEEKRRQTVESIKQKYLKNNKL